MLNPLRLWRTWRRRKGTVAVQAVNRGQYMTLTGAYASVDAARSTDIRPPANAAGRARWDGPTRMMAGQFPFLSRADEWRRNAGGGLS